MSTYLVVTGDYMAKIAKQLQIPLYSLMRANPQIPDKNKIYPGQVLNVPDTIGPPMLPPILKQPAPKLNVPDLPFIPGLIAPSLGPVAEDAAIQEVYIRYSIENVEPDHNEPGSAGAKLGAQFMGLSLPPQPWRMVRQSRGVALGHAISTKHTAIGSHHALRNASELESAIGIRYFSDWVVARYRYLQQDPDDGPGFSPPVDQIAFLNLYWSGIAKSPPVQAGE